MVFSIISAVFGGMIILAMGIAIDDYHDDYYYKYVYDPNHIDYAHVEIDDSPNGFMRHVYDAKINMVFMKLILILGIVEFAAGILAAACLCLMKLCTCCYWTAPK